MVVWYINIELKEHISSVYHHTHHTFVKETVYTIGEFYTEHEFERLWIEVGGKILIGGKNICIL